MLYDRILVRYGELTLKGKNKKTFISSANRMIQSKCDGLNVTFEKHHDRLYIILNGENYKVVEERLNLVFGLHSYSLVAKCEPNMDAMKELALKVVQNEYKGQNLLFKVETKRADKQFPIKSPEITKEIASHVLRNTEYLKTNVHNPDFRLNIEVRHEGCYMYTNAIRGIGGFPVGSAGKGLLMISGGIDSPVAGYLIQKRGVLIEAIHYESTPYTSIESAQKVIDLMEVIAKYAPKNKIKLHMVPFAELQMAIYNKAPDAYRMTLMRRMMYRIAERIAKKSECLIIANGESISQVASQTLESIYTINSVINMPVIRPVGTMDKLEIIDISKRIGTFDISIKPFEDCCTIYLPERPATKPTIERAEAYEKEFEWEELLEKSVEDTKAIYIKHGKNLNIADKGFEVKFTI